MDPVFSVFDNSSYVALMAGWLAFVFAKGGMDYLRSPQSADLRRQLRERFRRLRR